MSSWHLMQARRALAAGEVIAYPTEAVYGLGCLPEDAGAVLMLLTLKGRDPGKGLIVIAAGLEQLEPWLRFPDPATRARVAETWPGPVTWVVPASGEVPWWLTGGRPALAVRVTAHPVARALCRAFGPLVSTSANPAGRPPARSALQVRRYFGKDIGCIVPGELGGLDRPTVIRDAITGRILRGA